MYNGSISAEEISSTIINQYAYFDLVRFRMEKRLPKPIEVAMELLGITYRCRKRPHQFLPATPFVLEVFRPSVQALSILEPIMNKPSFLNYVEVAVDYDFSTHSDLDQAMRFFLNHLYMRRQLGEKIKINRQTVYFRRRKVKLNLVVYPSKPSRMTQNPCLHLEFRLTGSQVLKRCKIFNIEDLITFDFRTFFRKRLQFIDVNLYTIGKQFYGMARAKKPKLGGSRNKIDMFAMIGHLMRRRSALYLDNDDLVYCALNIYDSARAMKRFTGSAFKRIDNTPFLPPAHGEAYNTSKQIDHSTRPRA